MDKRIHEQCVLAFACVLAIGGVIQAKIIHVGSDVGSEYRSLRSAVNAAVSGDVIVVEEGLYTGDGNRDITIADKSLKILSQDPNDPGVVARTMIDCQGSAAQVHRAFSLRPGEGTRLTLEGLTIVNGYSFAYAGAVLCEGAELRLRNCKFSKNRTPSLGGAIYCSDSRVDLRGCTFSENVSDALRGGAIFSMTGVLHLEDCTFVANRGGTIENHDTSLTLTRCTFRHNTGKDGAAIHSRVGASPATPSCLSLSDCTFTANAASASGGALYNFEVSPMIDGCTFQDNTAGKDGGAILNHRASCLLTDCDLVGNVATGFGGALLSVLATDPQVVNCTLVANRADSGGAVAAKGSADLLISHSILWNNVAARGPSLCLARYEWNEARAVKAAVEYSDVEGGQGSACAESGCELVWASGNIDAEPLFAASADGNYRLSQRSPCIDAGDPCYVPDSGSIDRGACPRQFGPAVDLGAHEFHPLRPVYRLWSQIGNQYFYTVKEGEKDELTRESPHFWTLEGVAGYAADVPAAADLQPVYRFRSDWLGGHFWTISEEEREIVVQEYPDVWTFEGVAFYAYPPGKQPLGSLPVYRFWSREFAHHIFTMDEEQKNDLIENYAHLWDFEVVAWYLGDRPQRLEKAAYAFTGGAKGVKYALVLAATVNGQEAQVSTPEIILSPTAAQMQMTIDFDKLTATVDNLSAQAEMTGYEVEVSLPGTEVTIPLTLSMQTLFTLPTPRGPFRIDPQTGTFADFTGAYKNLTNEDSFFTYAGSVSIGNQVKGFERRLFATRLELSASGTLESLDSLPDGISARMPSTFQWRRQQTKDLIAEGSADGLRVQLYIASSYLGTQGLWQGTAAR